MRRCRAADAGHLQQPSLAPKDLMQSLQEIHWRFDLQQPLSLYRIKRHDRGNGVRRRHGIVWQVHLLGSHAGDPLENLKVRNERSTHLSVKGIKIVPIVAIDAVCGHPFNRASHKAMVPVSAHHFESTATAHREIVSSVAVTGDINQRGGGADRVNFRLVPDFTAEAREDDTEHRIFVQAYANQISIALLENMERQDHAGEQHGSQWKQR